VSVIGFVLFIMLNGAHMASAQPHGAADLESRLFAPCCYIQTLDVHESPLASELRAEIVARLKSGDAAQQIEDDLARRYGERIRAVPRGTDPRVRIPLVVGAVMLVSVAVLLALGLRWMRRSTPLPGARQAAATNPSYDAQLDAELRNLDQECP
jgi:cytochrome c-type biogenesis protein CcmH